MQKIKKKKFARNYSILRNRIEVLSERLLDLMTKDENIFFLECYTVTKTKTENKRKRISTRKQKINYEKELQKDHICRQKKPALRLDAPARLSPFFFTMKLAPMKRLEDRARIRPFTLSEDM